MMTRVISAERRTVFYLGTGLIALGLILCLSAFVIAFSHIDDGNFRPTAIFVPFLIGMASLGVGGVLRGIGARGLAGSGMVLDPDKARQELEPFSRMAGGMVKDALGETDLHLGGGSERVVMIKCTFCGKLNEEDSKFCQECGKGI
jgi:hypothetical protein